MSTYLKVVFMIFVRLEEIVYLVMGVSKVNDKQLNRANLFSSSHLDGDIVFLLIC